ncbi:MAG: bifunctional diaminohydroxyphosphoribosylaminopyrimidine deaminase/5-amino-6-(5-phosphoribosylamino)uracil reductase RibD [Candidatus Omnitrophica bacterium]|nr:bifunctional diaminohydroxyphosphoribosylaminopyrimidine deaminase/5-amino-6-(5-phosphoribosylamino)uracil reductase RibD [Candidatus Omnitrophota bacterium]
MHLLSETGYLSTDEKWMLRALHLAEKGRKTVSPNPMVGACVVKKNRIVAEGYHRFFGGDHAEVAALKRAGSKAKGATLCVTLEPCSTWGKTPPCVAAILNAGIQKVVIGALDPNPKHHGKGVKALRKAGVKVKTGVLAGRVEKQNESFFKFIRSRKPFVVLKMAQSLDGKIATKTGASRWITSVPARRFVHELRAEQDAILIGKNTLLKDNPNLSPRIKVRNQIEGKPWRVVIDPNLEVSPKANIFKGEQLTLLAVSEKTLVQRRSHEKSKQGKVLLPVHDKDGKLDLDDLLKKLASLGVAKLLCEGGGELAWSLLEGGHVDKIHWLIAPKLIGGRSAKTSVEGEGFRLPDDGIECEIDHVEKLGEDWHFVGKIKASLKNIR